MQSFSCKVGTADQAVSFTGIAAIEDIAFGMKELCGIVFVLSEYANLYFGTVVFGAILQKKPHRILEFSLRLKFAQVCTDEVTRVIHVPVLGISDLRRIHVRVFSDEQQQLCPFFPQEGSDVVCQQSKSRNVPVSCCDPDSENAFRSQTVPQCLKH